MRRILISELEKMFEDKLEKLEKNLEERQEEKLVEAKFKAF